MKFYTEIQCPRESRVIFPAACPACSAPLKEEKDKGERWATAVYGCGGSYKYSPQIQTHTNKWYGSCPQ